VSRRRARDQVRVPRLPVRPRNSGRRSLEPLLSPASGTFPITCLADQSTRLVQCSVLGSGMISLAMRLTTFLVADIGTRKLSPVLSTKNWIDRPFCYAEVLGNLSRNQTARTHFAYLQYIKLCQLRIAPRSGLPNGIPHVLRLRSSEKVIGSNAGRIVAAMTNLLTLDIRTRKHHGHSMRVHPLTLVSQPPIATASAPVVRVIPDPTLADTGIQNWPVLIYVCPELLFK
jgi:hypothetical protein